VFWVAAFSAFLAVNLVAASINHIDDTDETYGYWEPLHYLLYGSGLQTWEYAPQFAIRTYAFISPFYALVATSEQIITVSKLTVFKLIRVGLGLLAAYAEASFASSLRSAFGLQMALTTAAFMLCSPGLFFCATSYLPSAVCCTLLMLSSSAWLRGRFEVAILFGCVAVLCTGWPFVGLVFLPMGLHMLHARYSAANSQWSGLVGVVALAAVGLIEVAVIELAVLKIDLHYYNRVTSPTLNILLYNAMGSGDELYGVEPASYYIKNLFLNTGLAWPLFIAAPAVLSLRWALGGPRDNGATSVGAIFVLYLQAFIWLVVLFSRPHKEERFLYPIYPLMAFVAAHTLSGGLKLLESGCMAINSRSSHAATTEISSGSLIGMKKCIIFLCILLSSSLFTCRVISNYKNYSGYMRLWKNAGNYIDKITASGPTVSICTGSEWFTFPSHFFLPEGATLQFIEDGFTGILPQHFTNATEPRLPFNDQNREERSRYLSLSECDYIVLLVDQNTPLQGSLRRQLLESDLRDGPFRRVMAERVISPEYSANPFLRAYYIPHFTAASVQFRDYALYESTKPKKSKSDGN